MKHFYLTTEEWELLFTGLRYLELHHPKSKNLNLRVEFRDLLNTIIMQSQQQELFPQQR